LFVVQRKSYRRFVFYSFQREEDLGLIAGEFIEVLEKNDHGWWLGLAIRDGNQAKGYFPRNYIKEKPRVRNAPRPPPRPASLSAKAGTLGSTPAAGTSDTEKIVADMADMRVLEHPPSTSIKVNRGPSFSLRSLSAFDDLVNKGYAIEVKDKGKTNGGAVGSFGSLVEIQCQAMIWDGASTFTKSFANGVVKFIVGKHPIVPALQAVAQILGVGQTATVTCSPAMAYGQAGNPPYVPPNSYVVFEVTITNVSTPSDPNMEVEGPIELLIAGLPSSRSSTGANRRDSRILLVQPDVSKDSHAYEIDEGNH
jgi:hypothetical protein